MESLIGNTVSEVAGKPDYPQKLKVLAVSKPNFASKHSLESSRRDLHNALLWTFAQLSNLLFQLPKHMLNLP